MFKIDMNTSFEDAEYQALHVPYLMRLGEMVLPDIPAEEPEERQSPSPDALD